MLNMVQDLRFAARSLRRTPGLTLAAVVTLGLGIGATTATFSVINGVVLRPLPYDEPEALVQMWERLPQAADASVSFPNYLDWREQATVFEDLAAFVPRYVSAGGDGNPERLTAYHVSASLFGILRGKPLLGRAFLEQEDRAGGPPVAVISHSLWQSRFGADPNVVGREIVLDDRAHTIVGVMPRSFAFPPTYRSVDLWRPIGQLAVDEWLDRSNHLGIQVLGRLDPGVTLERAREEMDAIARRLEQHYAGSNTGARVNLAPMRDRVLGDAPATLALALAAVTFVLLIACANVANLLLARATSRQREIAIRRAMGASRGRIVRLLLAESTMLAVLGGLAGLALAHVVVRVLSGWLSTTLPRTDQVSMDGRVLAFALTASALTGVLAGLTPALASARTDLHKSLRQGRGESAARRRRTARKTLVVAEVALAQVLLVGAVSMIHSLLILVNEQTGMDPRNLLTLSISLSETRYPELGDRHAFFNRLVDRIKRLPGVLSAGAGGPLPLTPGGWQSAYEVEGEPPASPGQEPIVDVCVSTPDLIRTLGIPLLRGRHFTEHDADSRVPVAIIDERFARRHWPDADPIGKHVRQSGRTWEIVGVVGHVNNRSARPASLVQMYTPLEWDSSAGWSLAIRTEVEPTLLIDAVRTAVLDLDPDRPIYNVRPMATYLSDSTANERFLSLVLGAFSAAALLLASVGVYGVVSHTTNELRPEIGIRMAVGATGGQVVRMVLREGVSMVALGMGVALPLVLAMGPAISSRLYGVTAAEPATLLTASLLLAGVASVACYLPALRAAAVDPVTTLRSE